MRGLARTEELRLRAIQPPPAEAAVYHMMTNSGPSFRLAAHLRQAAVDGDMARFRRLAAESVRRQRRYDAIERSAGLNDCIALR